MKNIQNFIKNNKNDILKLADEADLLMYEDGGVYSIYYDNYNVEKQLLKFVELLIVKINND